MEKPNTPLKRLSNVAGLLAVAGASGALLWTIADMNRADAVRPAAETTSAEAEAINAAHAKRHADRLHDDAMTAARATMVLAGNGCAVMDARDDIMGLEIFCHDGSRFFRSTVEGKTDVNPIRRRAINGQIYDVVERRDGRVLSWRPEPTRP